jgi:N-acetylglucosamine-6-phosphate deacetylase
MATREQLHDAVSAGATVSTHLGNGIAATLPRHDNPIWHQLADDRLTATLIADGHHLPAEIFKVITAAKSTDKVILISDAGTLAGQPAGRYRDWGQEFDVLADGKIVVPGTPYLAGAGHGLDHAVRWLRANRLADESAIERMACVNPRRMLGLPVPELRIGAVWSDFQFVS